jgi:hypothetical protein
MGVDRISDGTETGKRKGKRARVLLSATIRTADGEFPARLRDLSQRGALLETKNPPPVGSDITFLRGETVVTARVAWAGGNRIGIEFTRPIDEHEVLVHIGTARFKPKEEFRRPRIQGEDLTPHERKLMNVFTRSIGIGIIAD